MEGRYDDAHDRRARRRRALGDRRGADLGHRDRRARLGRHPRPAGPPAPTGRGRRAIAADAERRRVRGRAARVAARGGARRRLLDHRARGSDWTRLAPVEADLPDRRFNDGKCDPVGRFLAGFDGLRQAARRPAASTGSTPTARSSSSSTDVTISNGLTWSPDGTTLYYIDTPTRPDRGVRLRPRDRGLEPPTHALTLPDGEPGSPRRHDDGHRRRPVGRACGAAGRSFASARMAGSTRSSRCPPSHVTSCIFGGPDLDDLYITCAWSELHRRRARRPAVRRLAVPCPPGRAWLPTGRVRRVTCGP